MTDQSPIPFASFFSHDDLTPEQRRDDRELLRHVANTAMFYALCRQVRGGCLRAQRCRGEPHECVGRFIDLLPGEVWEWIEAALEGWREERTFEEVAEDYPDELAALVAWRDALAKATA
jgi:hypothetical protein